jgi:glutathione S-transferase
LKLYYAPGACSLAPHIALCEAGLAYEIEQVDLAAKRTASGDDFNAVNPKGYVPALRLDDGQVLTEASAVLQYIADQAPAAGLLPQGGMARYRTLEWLNFVATELHKGFGPLWKPDTPDAYKVIARQNLARRLAYLDSRIAERDHLTAAGFGIADAYAFTILSWGGFHKIDLAQWPNVQRYHGRIAERPAVQRALREEGLLK